MSQQLSSYLDCCSGLKPMLNYLFLQKPSHVWIQVNLVSIKLINFHKIKNASLSRFDCFTHTKSILLKYPWKLLFTIKDDYYANMIIRSIWNIDTFIPQCLWWLLYSDERILCIQSTYLNIHIKQTPLFWRII